jgi:plasmid stability protein
MIAFFALEVPMADVLVRDLDPEVVERLKTFAKEENRSLQAEMKEILTRAAQRLPRLSRLERIRKIKESISKRPQTDSAVLLREDRDR